MLVPITERREQISELFKAKDLNSLIGLGIERVGNEEAHDCAAYVLERLGFVSNEKTSVVLNKLPNSDAPPRGSGIIFYGFQEKQFNIRHYGWYDSGKVFSKWGHWFVLKHDIADVPDWYGNAAKFREDDTEVRAQLQLALQGINNE